MLKAYEILLESYLYSPNSTVTIKRANSTPILASANPGISLLDQPLPPPHNPTHRHTHPLTSSLTPHPQNQIINLQILH